jgi:hypothetical protein
MSHPVCQRLTLSCHFGRFRGPTTGMVGASGQVTLSADRRSRAWRLSLIHYSHSSMGVQL